MAEYCASCAKKYNGGKIEPFYNGEICEGCGKIGTYIPLLKRILNLIKPSIKKLLK